ncbi:MAG: alkaline phosphatase D family protein [Planctomycetaceae bacterium]|nr:alkaline phosphatase D family protein [Planctomycetaceae bacterium]
MPLHPAVGGRRYGIDRRRFLQYMAAVSAIPAVSARADHSGESGAADVRFDSNPFSLGVASGDPEADGVVLWTRLAPEPLTGGGMPSVPVRVDWEVADDEQFSKVVRTGSALALPQLGHSVHVEVAGLQPHRWYFYRFHVGSVTGGSVTSPIGRTRTAPNADALPPQLRFAFTSCQHYEYGYFNGYPHMQQEDLDLVIHLGDYIYEYGGLENRPRKHFGSEIVTLNDYRTRYAQYRLDAGLQDTHRLFPWLVTWDDHEFDNNYADLVSEEEGVSPEEFLVRRMNAYQAYYEFMPLRRRSFPRGPHMTLYRGCRYGRLANFQVLDTRQYRTDQPNGDHQKPMTGKVFDPQATMLGDRQESWLMSQLLQSESTWNILAQQVMMAPLNRGEGENRLYSMDQWPGYEVSRRRLLQFFHDRQVPNPVVLTGDIHLNWVNDLQLNFEDPQSPVVGTELVGTSMTSGGNGGNHIPEYERAAAQNSFVKWYNSNRGYVSCEVTPSKWTTRYRITPYVDRPGSPVETAAAFVIEAGRPGAQRDIG